MNTKKFLLAILGYILVAFICGASWHLVLFKNVYDDLNVYTRKEPIIPLGIISMLIQGIILAYIYPLFQKGISPIREGWKFGLLIAAFLGSVAVFAEAAHQEITSLSTWLILESIYYVIQFSIAGIVIGIIYGKK